jgi:hypothetical protein
VKRIIGLLVIVAVVAVLAQSSAVAAGSVPGNINIPQLNVTPSLRVGPASLFFTPTGIRSQLSGSPVTPPAQVTVCLHGVTRTVPLSSVWLYITLGATLGPCIH